LKTITLRIDDELYNDTENLVSKINKSRNKYISEALEYFNKKHTMLLLEEQLKFESKLVQVESMKVLHEFEALID
jgi:predicted DNA-binding protein